MEDLVKEREERAGFNDIPPIVTSFAYDEFGNMIAVLREGTVDESGSTQQQLTTIHYGFEHVFPMSQINPVPPGRIWGSRPCASSTPATNAVVWNSVRASSGCACRCRRQAIRSLVCWASQDSAMSDTHTPPLDYATCVGLKTISRS